MKRLTRKKAKRLSLLKWAILKKRGLSAKAKEMAVQEHSELNNLEENCGFCEYTVQRGSDCDKTCPLAKGMGCCGGTYAAWLNKPTICNAQAVYDYIDEYG